MSASRYIAIRLGLGSEGRKSSPAIKVSIAAVALSVAVMLAAIAVVKGFKREIRDKVIGFNSHITVYNVPGQDEENVLTLTPTLSKVLEETPGVTDYSLEISIPAILKTPTDFKGIYLRSLNGAGTRDFITDNLEEGSIPDFSKNDSELKIVISRIAARELGLKTGDRIDTYFIADDVRVRRMEVAGIYNSHFDSYDKVICYGSMPLIQKLAGIPGTQGTSIQVQTDNFSHVEQITEILRERLDTASGSGLLNRFYRVDNAPNQGAGYFQWLSLLDMNVVVILTLMTLVAVATLISGMLILILDKKRTIGIVRALGASVSCVRNVFVLLALKVALWGMAIGNVLMLGLLWLQKEYHLLPLDAEAYYIDFVPVEINVADVLLLNVGVLAVVWFSLVVPSKFAAKISPSEIIRNDS